MRFFWVTILILLAAAFSNAKSQQKPENQSSQTINVGTKVKQQNAAISSAQMTLAYAEVFAQKVEAEAELKVLIIDMTDDAPQVREKKLRRDSLQREIEWLEKLPAASHSKMTLALGKIIVRKVQAEVDQKMLAENYADEHPLIKKARARLAVYKDEIDKLLQ